MKQPFFKLGFLFFVILFVGESYSQENFLPGYIITAKGDTIFGSIDYKNWDNNPKKVRFKNNSLNKEIFYNPTEIIEFGVKDEIYVSGIVKAEISTDKLDKINEDPTLKFRVDTIFLQTLFQGNKSLYYYKNNKIGKNFYIKRDTSFELLIYKKYLKNDNGKKMIAENKRYIGQLILYLNDCPSISSHINQSTYNQKSLIKIYQEYYNKCANSQLKFQRKPEKNKTEKGFVVGATITSLVFKSDSYPYLTDSKFNPSLNFSVGVFYNVVLPRNQGKWSIYNEILLSSYYVSGQYEEFTSENKYTITSVHLGFSYLNLNHLVKYKYPIGGVYINLDAGISNGFMFGATNYKSVYSKFYDTESTRGEAVFDNMRKYELGLIIGSGVNYNKLSFDIRYERGNGMSDYNKIKSRTNSFAFLLGYKF